MDSGKNIIKKEFEIITLDWKEKGLNDTLETGLYQIYGDSPIYGRGVLLYIGKSTKLDERIQSHFESKESFIGRQPNKSCRYAFVEDSKLEIVEQILIVMHKPSFNSNHIIHISLEARENLYLIQNHGERGMLHLEVSNYYFKT